MCQPYVSIQLTEAYRKRPLAIQPASEDERRRDRAHHSTLPTAQPGVPPWGEVAERLERYAASDVYAKSNGPNVRFGWKADIHNGVGSDHKKRQNDMTFISERTVTAKRTWDPERGIDLICEKRLSDGTMYMRLVKSESTYRFAMQTTHEEPASGSEKPTIVRHVAYPKMPFADFSIDETASVLRESLEAFKGIYGLHPDENVRVAFKR